MTTTRTYLARETRVSPCDSCGEPITSGERYAISLNGRNQTRCFHIECPAYRPDDETADTSQVTA